MKALAKAALLKPIADVLKSSFPAQLSWPLVNEWPKRPWQNFSSHQLLRQPVSKLGLQFESSPLRRFREQLYRDLQQAGLQYFKPEIYFGDEWFSPDRVPKISVPFYLAHPALRKIEKSLMGEVEGGTPRQFMQLLRHESGHAFDHAYRCSSRSDWQNVFGSPKAKYDPDNYTFNPRSRDFVRHLPKHYAQSHPDEDFAETFAVLITPNSQWRQRYQAGTGAREKLEFVYSLIQSFSARRPAVTSGPRMCLASRMQTSLVRYYKGRIASDSLN